MQSCFSSCTRSCSKKFSDRCCPSCLSGMYRRRLHFQVSHKFVLCATEIARKAICIINAVATKPLIAYCYTQDGSFSICVVSCDIGQHCSVSISPCQEGQVEAEFVNNVPAGNIAVNGGPMVRKCCFVLAKLEPFGASLIVLGPAHDLQLRGQLWWNRAKWHGFPA